MTPNLRDANPNAFDALIEALERLESHLHRDSEMVCGLLRAGGASAPGELGSVVRRYLAIMAELQDAVLELKWALMESGADADSMANRVAAFKSLDELLEDLRRA